MVKKSFWDWLTQEPWDTALNDADLHSPCVEDFSGGMINGMTSVIRKEIVSPAKINLHLSIEGGKRPDGFHPIESILVPVSCYDHIDFRLSLCSPFSVTIGGMDEVPLEQNLMFRAANLFREESGIPFSLQIDIEKHIPSGAGLGGGSSNAAAVLNALNEAMDFPISRDMLLSMAARLGSDIPFFMAGQPAFAAGHGEILFPFALKSNFFLVLVKPDFASNTAEAYRLLDEEKRHAARNVLPRETLIAALENPPAEWPYYNDFQNIFLNGRYPYSAVYREIFSRLNESRAPFSALSGSGSCVFGVFETENAAIHAAARLESHYPFVRHCTIPRTLGSD
jgi:4-diphosphocytidyl-2-C-methyl-D-erythritol kinase